MVTGGAGYIGSHFCQTALHVFENELSDVVGNNYEIIVYDNLHSGFRESIPEKIQFCFGDIRDLELLNRLMKDKKVDTVVHFAALSVVPDSMKDPLNYYEQNVTGTLRVLEACVNNKVRNFIFSSSASVYGNVDKSPIHENSELLPVSPYGKSKKMGEEIALDFSRRYGIRTAILRYFNVAGADPLGKNGQRTKNATHLIKVAAECAVGKRNKLQIYGKNFSSNDGTGVRDYIHVQDLVDLHLQALKYLELEKKDILINCGYGRGYSVLQVCQAMEKISGKKLEIEFVEQRPGDVGVVFADTGRMTKLWPQWKPKYSNLEKICESAYLWESKNL